MPRHEDFEKIYQQMIEQYGEEKGKQVYYAWLKKMGYDDTKLMPKRESFSWTGSIKQIPGTSNLIRGQALHPIKTYHMDEWPSVRIYLEEELEKAAHTLTGKSLLIDHLYPIDGKVLDSRYEDGAVEYIAEISDEQILSWIRDGTIKHCSVEYDWSSLEKVDGVAPRGIEFTGLALLKNFEPGDPATSVEVWNRIAEALKKLKEAEWDTAYINDLPDSAFAVISKGGEKDDQGKTVPRTLRYLPHHNAQGNLDLPHLRNALARLPQTDLSPEELAEAKRHLCAHAKDAEIASDVCDLEPSKEMVEALQNHITILLDQKKALQEEVKALTKRRGEAVIEPQHQEDFKKMVLKELKGCVYERVPLHWGYGPFEQNRRIKELIRKLESQSPVDRE